MLGSSIQSKNMISMQWNKNISSADLNKAIKNVPVYGTIKLIRAIIPGYLVMFI